MVHIDGREICNWERVVCVPITGYAHVGHAQGKSIISWSSNTQPVKLSVIRSVHGITPMREGRDRRERWNKCGAPTTAWNCSSKLATENDMYGQHDFGCCSSDCLEFVSIERFVCIGDAYTWVRICAEHLGHLRRRNSC